jgi:hypothetical protein
MAAVVRPRPGQDAAATQVNGGGAGGTSGLDQSAGSTTAGAGSASPSGDRAARTTAGGQGTSSGNAAGAGPGGPAGPGVTATTVTVGLHLADPNQDTYLKALGAQGVSTGDEKGEADAVIAYINSHGGVAGRRLVPVLHYYATNSESFSAMYQEACAAFTQDTKVFAAISTSEFQQLDVLATCLKGAGSLLVFQNRLLWDQQVFDSYAPYVYSPSYLRGDRWAVVVDGLAAQGFFGPGSRVGLIYMDSPAAIRVKDRVVKPRIAAHGGSVVAEASVPNYDSITGLSDASSAMASAVLQFRSAGASQVFAVGTNGTGYFFFPAEAESQAYRPRYGFDSTEIPQIVAANAPAAQMHGARGVGWWPTYDVDAPQDPGGNPARALCDNILAGAGIHPNSRFAENDAIDICDSLLFLKAGLDRAAVPNASDFRAAVDRFEAAYNSPFTFSTMFVPGRYDGASTVRPEAFDDSCTCWNYSGPTAPAP